MNSRLQHQIAFLMEIDKLKQVFRQTYLLDESRRENDAEHSWHFAMFALILSEYAPHPVDLLKVMKMALIHDIVEIDAGDTFLYDVAGNKDKAEREEKAAERIFGLLPDDQRADIRALWEEFEEKKTPEARFAGAVDRLHPFLHNIYTDGRTWREHGISAKQVLNRNRPIEDGAPDLWDMAQQLIEEAVMKGHVARD